MTIERQNYLYTASGLKNVILEDLEVRHCPSCGERQAVIPRINDLHKQLALYLVKKDEKLLPEEIIYLRKYLGWTGTEFARKFKVKPETISRWENGAQEMGKMAEALLRLWVAIENAPKNFAHHILEQFGNNKNSPQHAQIRASMKKNWHLAA
jgi:putative zinc finger/helix-turn-helix YgiT family protein